MSAPSAEIAAADDPLVQKALQALRENRPRTAELALRGLLEQPSDSPNVTAMTLLADALVRMERFEEAEGLLKRSIEVAPNFVAAHHALVTVFLMRGRRAEALAQVAELMRLEPNNPAHHGLKAMALVWVGQHGPAAKAYEDLLATEPKHPAPWIAYAHTLRTLGRSADAATAYRNATERFPRLGEAYWGLANLKTFRFADGDIATMRAQITASDTPVESRIQIRFALGKALEDRGAYAEAFEHYSEANSLKRVTQGYNAEATSAFVTNCKSLYSPGFLAEQAGGGSPEKDPIFIVGLPRSGSTLIEQILASHSQIEGTMELRILPYIVGRIGSKGATRFIASQTHRALRTDMQAPYPEILRNLDRETCTILGEEYLKRAQMHRVLERPFFTDKMPDNFAHAGFTHLILPNAKIIDVRRHPMACCVSNFRHYFPVGKDFSYSLTDLGRYYADYVELMAHFDEVLPGKVYRVFYEQLTQAPEREIRRLFDYVGLTFEEQCLRFHETERPVRTASAEQVRMPVYKDARHIWRNYEPWLDPLKAALGPALANYPFQ